MTFMDRKRKRGEARKLSISWPIDSQRPLCSSDKSDGSDTDRSIALSNSRRSSASSRSSWRMHPYSWSSQESTPRHLSLTSAGLGTHQRTSIASTATCSCPPEVLDSPDKLPTQEALDKAGEISIFDADGNSRAFKSLYDGPLAIGEQQLIIFIRHFFCGACQSYLKALSHAISLKTYFSLPTPTSITIIGLGDPSLIPTYRDHTNTPFPLYTDPTRRLHRLLGMGWSLNMGKRAKYCANVNEVQWIAGQLAQMKEVPEKEKRFRGGGWWWLGGEFLIRDGKLVWCHRMKSYRDHAEMDVLKQLLKVEE